MFAARCLSRPTRSFASIAPANVSPFLVFDRRAKQLQKDRAASKNDGADSRTVDYIRNEVADRMLERFEVGTTMGQRAILISLLGHQTQIWDRRRSWLGTRSFYKGVRPGKRPQGHHGRFQWYSTNTLFKMKACLCLCIREALTS